jgi:hypothetical protein
LRQKTKRRENDSRKAESGRRRRAEKGRTRYEKSKENGEIRFCASLRSPFSFFPSLMMLRLCTVMHRARDGQEQGENTANRSGQQQRLLFNKRAESNCRNKSRSSFDYVLFAVFTASSSALQMFRPGCFSRQPQIEIKDGRED